MRRLLRVICTASQEKEAAADWHDGQIRPRMKTARRTDFAGLGRVKNIALAHRPLLDALGFDKISPKQFL
jgi:hypothetical protein